ncbi:LOW QUALITY PROTEIN: uncharacterized protein V1477_012142 [Vespula maculifrons]|uniref:Uncharacterized protein n=1 Tax=Vespula maculifrons TaxID=7453 RepID=A0ABD2BWM8_VESMC
MVKWGYSPTLGILGFAKQQQYRTSERLLQSPVQLCFGLRRGNLEIFADTIPSSINEKFTQVQYCITHTFEILSYFFCFRIRVCTLGDFENLSRRVDFEIFADTILGILGFAKQQQYRTSERLLQSLAQLCFGLRRGNLEIFADTIPSSINEMFTQTSSLHCRTKIAKWGDGLERRQQYRTSERLLQSLAQLCFGLRRGNLEIFADTIPSKFEFALSATLKIYLEEWTSKFSRIPFVEVLSNVYTTTKFAKWGDGLERRQQYRTSERLLQSLAQLCFGLRRGNLEIFANTIPSSINEMFTQTSSLHCRTKFAKWGDGLERRQQYRTSERLLQSLAQLCFGLRRGNLEIFADTTRASIKEQLILGILGFAKQQQYRTSERLLQSLAQLCFGLRRGNLEIFADTIPSTIYEVFTQVQYCITHIFEILLRFCTFGDFENLSRRMDLKVFADTKFAKWGDGLERRQQYGTSDRLIQSLVQLCFGLRRGNLEIFADTIPSTIYEVFTQVQYSITHIFEILYYFFSFRLRVRTFGDFENLSRRMDLKVFADAIRASIREQLIRIYNSLFDLRLNLRITSSVVFWAPTRELRNFRGYHPFYDLRSVYASTILLRFCTFGDFENLSRRMDLKVFADVIRASIREQLIRIYNSLFDLKLNLRITSSVVFWAPTRELRNFRGYHPFYDLRSVYASTILLRFCTFGDFENLSRRMDLKVFADAIRASIREQLIRIYNSLFDLRLNLRITSSVVFWAPTRELRNFRGYHPFYDLRSVYASTILLRFCTFGDFENLSRRMDLKVFADVIRASIREQLIRIYNSLFDLKLNLRSGETVSRDDNNMGPLTDLYKFEFALSATLKIYLEEWTSKFSRIPFVEVLSNVYTTTKFAKWGDGLERRQQYRTSERLLQSLAQLCFGLRRGNLEIFANTIPSSINEMFTQTSSLHCRTKFAKWGDGLERRQQYRTSERLLQSLAQLCFGLRRGNLEIFADTTRASIKEQLILGILGFAKQQQYRTSERLLQSLAQLCFGLRRGNLEIFADTIPSTIYEVFTQVQYCITHIFEILLRFCTFGDFENLSRRMDLKVFADTKFAKWGDGLERRQQYGTSDRLIQSLVQLCFGLRRGNLEIFADTIPSTIYEVFTQVQYCITHIFEILLRFCTFGDFENLSRRMDLKVFADVIRASIREQLIRIYNSLFDLKLNLRITSSVVFWTSTRELRNFRGYHPFYDLRSVYASTILLRFCTFGDFENLSRRMDLKVFADTKFAKWGDGLERRQQYGTSDRLIQSLVQLCFGLRRGNLEIFADTIPSTIYEVLTQVQYCITHIFEILLRVRTFGDFENLSRRMDLKVFADAIRASIREQLIRIYNSLFDLRLNLRSGETVSRDDNNMGPLTDLYIQLCFGLRRGNLEIFADTIPSTIYEEFTQVQYSITHIFEILYYFFSFRLRFCTFGDFENLSRRMDLKVFADAIRASIREQLIRIYNSLFDLRLNLRITSSVVFWAPTRELRNFRGYHPFYDLRSVNASTILLRFCTFGDFENLSRRMDLKVFADTKFAKWGDGLERRQQYGTSDRLIQSLVQLCFGLRRGNLEIFADTIPSTIYEVFTQVQYSITHIFEILYYFFSFRLRVRTFGDFENLSRRMDLKVFADAIRANIREQLIRIYNSLFDLRLNLCSGETVSRDDNNMGPLTDLYIQLCFGLRRGNLEIFADTIPSTIYEEFTQVQYSITHIFEILYYFFSFRLRFCTFGDFENLSRRMDLKVFADAIRASIREQLIRIYNSLFDLRLNLRITSSVVFWAPTRELRNFRGYHPFYDLRSVYASTILLRFCTFGDFENLSRRMDLKVFADVIRASIREQLIRIYNSLFDLKLNLRITSSVVFWTSTRELRNFRGYHPFYDLRSVYASTILLRFCTFGDFENLSRRMDLKVFADTKFAKWGDGLERRQQYGTSDRLIQSLVQLCFGLRRGNLEIFADTIPSTIYEVLTQVQYCITHIFEILLRVRTFGDFENLSRRMDLKVFADAIRASIREQLIRIYNSLFDLRLNLRSGETVSRDDNNMGPLTDLYIQLCFGLRRGNLEIFADTIPSTIYEEFTQVQYSITHIFEILYYFFSFRLRFCTFGDFENLSRRMDLKVFADAIRASIREQLIRIYNSLFDLRLNLRITSSVVFWAPTRELRNFRGYHPFYDLRSVNASTILLRFCTFGDFENLSRRMDLKVFADTKFAKWGDGLERRQQYGTSDRLIQSLVQLCFGLRRGNLEIFADTIPSTIYEVFTQVQYSITHIFEILYYFFSFRLRVRTFGDFENLSRRMDLKVFADAIRANIREQLIRIYNSLFDLRLNLCSGETVSRDDNNMGPLTDLYIQLCFGLRRGNLEIFADTIPSTIYEEFTQVQYSITHIFEILYYFFSFRLRFCTFGDFENLSRRMDLKVFADAIRASIREQLIRIYNSLFDLRLNLRITSSVVFWAPTRELRNFRGYHPFYDLRSVNASTILLRFCTFGDFENLSRRMDLKVFADTKFAKWGDGLERRQQYGTSDRLIQSLVQLCFGLRRGNLEIFADTIPSTIYEVFTQVQYSITHIFEILYYFFSFRLRVRTFGDFENLSRRMDLKVFADAIRANIREQLIRIYNSLFDLRLNLCSGETVSRDDNNMGPLTDLYIQLCFGLRRGNLEIFADTIPSTIYEEFTQVQYSITHIFEILYYFFSFRLRFCTFGDFENLSRRMDLKVFADAIRASIREQLIRIYNSLFDSRLNLRITSSVVFWTSTRELRNFRGYHPFYDLRRVYANFDFALSGTLKIYLEEWT